MNPGETQKWHTNTAVGFFSGSSSDCTTLGARQEYLHYATIPISIRFPSDIAVSAGLLAFHNCSRTRPQTKPRSRKLFRPIFGWSKTCCAEFHIFRYRFLRIFRPFPKNTCMATQHLLGQLWSTLFRRQWGFWELRWECTYQPTDSKQPTTGLLRRCMYKGSGRSDRLGQDIEADCHLHSSKGSTLVPRTQWGPCL